jgi:tripartite-type tricarboxylate transporter receptor subunit TctC
MKSSRRQWLGALVCALAAFGSPALWAQAPFPSKTVKLVVPFPAGGVGDLVARTLSTKLSALLGQPVIVDNRAGASAIIGSEYVARAEPDGYTLLVASLPVLSINPLQFENLPYKPEKDLVPVALVANQPYLITVQAAVPAKTLPEFIALAKRQPGKFNFGSSSSSIYLATELLNSRAGMQLNHIPYKGSAPALNDLLGGHIDLLLDTFSTLWPQVKSGKVKALAITAAQRSKIATEVPTAAEAGLKDLNITSWQAIMAPAGTPRPVIDTLNAALNKVVQDPEVIEAFARSGVTPQTGSPAAAAEFIHRESQLWSSIAKQVGMRPGSMQGQ